MTIPDFDRVCLNGAVIRAACEDWWWRRFNCAMPPMDYYDNY